MNAVADVRNLRSKRRCTLYPTTNIPKNGTVEIIKHFNPKHYLDGNESELPEVGLEEDDEREFVKSSEIFRPVRQNISPAKQAQRKSSDIPKIQNVLLDKILNPPAKQKEIKVKPTPRNTVTKKARQQHFPVSKYKNNRRTASTDSSSSDQTNNLKPNRPVCRAPNCKAKKVVNTTLDSIRNKREIKNCVKATLKQLGTTKIDIKLNTTHNKIFAQKTDAVQCNPRNEGYMICASYVQQLKEEINTAKTDSKGEIYDTANQLKNEIAEYVNSKNANNKYRVVTNANAEVKVVFNKNRGNCTLESVDLNTSKHELKNAATSISWCEYCALSKRYHEMQIQKENLMDEVIRTCDEKLICTHSFEQSENRGITDAAAAASSLNKTFTKEVPVQDNCSVATDGCDNKICRLSTECSNLRIDEILADRNMESVSLYSNGSSESQRRATKIRIEECNLSLKIPENTTSAR